MKDAQGDWEKAKAWGDMNLCCFERFPHPYRAAANHRSPTSLSKEFNTCPSCLTTGLHKYRGDPYGSKLKNI